jgi:hypothetical protein
MIELVPMAYRIVNDVDARQQAEWDAGRSTAQSPVSGRKDGIATSASAAGGGGGGSVSASGSVGGRSGNAVKGSGAAAVAGGRRMDEEEERDAVFWRLEGLGYRVGQGLVERFVFPSSLFMLNLLLLLPCDSSHIFISQSPRTSEANLTPKLADSPAIDRASRILWIV